MKKITNLNSNMEKQTHSGAAAGLASNAAVNLDASEDVSQAGGMAADDLSQVRELLFGGAVRDLAKQRQNLQEETNAGFAESDRRTKSRLDDLYERLNSLSLPLKSESETRQAALEKLTRQNQELIAKLAQKSQDEAARIGERIGSETMRVDALLEKQSHTSDKRDAAQQTVLAESVISERQRMAEALYPIMGPAIRRSISETKNQTL